MITFLTDSAHAGPGADDPQSEHPDPVEVLENEVTAGVDIALQ